MIWGKSNMVSCTRNRCLPHACSTAKEPRTHKWMEASVSSFHQPACPPRPGEQGVTPKGGPSGVPAFGQTGENGSYRDQLLFLSFKLGPEATPTLSRNEGQPTHLHQLPSHPTYLLSQPRHPGLLFTWDCRGNQPFKSYS